MSDRVAGEEEKAAAARRGPARQGHGPMAVPTEKSASFWPSARRLLGRLRPERRLLVAVLLLAVVSVALTAYGPLVLARATDAIFAGFIGSRMPPGVSVAQAEAGLRAQGQDRVADMVAAIPGLVPGQGVDLGLVARVLLFALALYLVAAVLGWAQGYLLAGVVQRSVYRLRADVEDKLHRLPLPFFDAQPRGEVLSRVTNDIDNVAQSLQQTLSQLMTSLLTVLAMVAMMVWVSPLLALIAVVTIPVTMVVTAFIGKRAQSRFRAQWKHTGELNGLIEETFTGHTLVNVFGRRQAVRREFTVKNDELYRAAFGAQFISGLIMPTMMFIGNLNYVAIAVVGGLQVATGVMTIGAVQAFIQYSRQFTQPLTQVASMANLMQSGVASAERVFDLLDQGEQIPDRGSDLDLRASRGRVAFEDVTFSYLPDTPLIEHLSLTVEPGQTVAIVGPTGAGKTTLVNLVMRFYELTSGRITLDGVDITQIPRRRLRERVGMVLQDTWLFHGTIAENIAYARPRATRQEVVAAATATYVDRFVHSLPDGYDTVIDEEGSNISAGQRQLVTIARAFLSDPALLILDEATSSVDTRTERLVQQAMTALRSQRTSFVIAHRLSTIRDADLILVMEAGSIVEQGTHDDLLTAAGAYARLYQAQFQGPAEQV